MIQPQAYTIYRLKKHNEKITTKNLSFSKALNFDNPYSV